MSEEEQHSKSGNYYKKDKKSRYEEDYNKQREYNGTSPRSYYQSKYSHENYLNRQYKDDLKDGYDRQNSSDTSIVKNSKNEKYRKPGGHEYRNSFYDTSRNGSFERSTPVDNSRSIPQDTKPISSPYFTKTDTYESKNSYYDRNGALENGRYYGDSYKSYDQGRYSESNEYGSRSYDSYKRQGSYDDSYKRYRLDTRYPSDGYSKHYRPKHIPAGPNNTIGLFGFNSNTTEDDLKNLLNKLFADRFEYTSKLIMDERTGLCKGFCFIDFKCLDHAITAKTILSKESFRGQDFKCDYSYKQGILGPQD